MVKTKKKLSAVALVKTAPGVFKRRYDLMLALCHNPAILNIESSGLKILEIANKIIEESEQ